MEIEKTNNELSNLSVEQLTTEILIYKKQTAQGIIEIGKRLAEVQDRYDKNEIEGNFTDYLHKIVEFKQSTAYNFIKIAKENHTFQAIGKLPITKIYALLSVPADERETFIQEKHEINGKVKTVDEMTTRELQKVIQEKKELERMLEAERNKPQPEPRIEYKENPETLSKLEKYENELTRNYEKITIKENTISNLNNKIAYMEKQLKDVAELKNKEQLIKEMHDKIESLKSERSKAVKEMEDDMKVFRFIRETKEFIRKEMLHIPTLTINFNQTEVMKKDIKNICELLDNFTFSLKQKFGV